VFAVIYFHEIFICLGEVERLGVGFVRAVMNICFTSFSLIGVAEVYNTNLFVV
jgi:hypothetical protein